MGSATAILVLGMLVAGPIAAAYQVEPVSEQEVKAWLEWVIPLPKQVEITGKAAVPVSKLRVSLHPEASELERQAVAELAELLKDKTGLDVTLLNEGEREQTFIVSLIRSPVARPMIGEHPNTDQGYTIIRTLDDHEQLMGVCCTALTDVGTYYAMKTLKQLLAPTIRGDGGAATVDVPACKIVDWPDMEERGEWGGSASADLEWMAERKFNLIERHADLTVDENGVGHATMDEELMERARKHAMRIVPIIHHLEQLKRTGMFEAYPQLKAIGPESSNPSVQSVCFARPEIVTLVSQWLAELGQIPGVSDVMIWLSEEGKGCQCEECQKHDRFVNETRVCVAAWEQAKKTCPDLGLRLLLTQYSYKSNDKVLAAVPEGVKVSYYHGGLTYNTTRNPMIYPLLEEYVKQGRWMGVYPTLSASWRIVAPFSNPQFTHYRMTEFVDKGLQCLVAYAVPTNWYYQVNVEGAMEWSWNAHGRSAREFAISYAMRHGINEAEKFAEWTEILSPVSWDVYGSNFPYREVYGGTDSIVRGSIKLGTGIFSEFKREEQFDEDLAKCEAALTLANETGDEGVILETRIVQGYVRVLKAVWELSKVVHGDEGVSEEDREAAKRHYELFNEGCGAVVTLYPKWSNAVAPQLTGKEPGRFWDTVDTMERLAGRIADLMGESGFEDKEKPYRLHVIGSWKTEEFEDKSSQVRQLDVTEFVAGPGTYWFRPKWRSGSLGLGASKVALVSYPKGKPDDLREEAVDKHECHAGAWVKGDVYTLELEEQDPNRGYAVVAHIRGGKTTSGEFQFRKLRPEGQ